MTESRIKEEISISYTKVISSLAGMTCSLRDGNIDFGIDGSIYEINYNPKRRRYIDCSFGIDFQVKSTTNIIHKSGVILYDLEVKNYLDLIDVNVGRNRILILFVFPKDRSLWAEVGENETIIKKCAYWCSLRGMPEVDNKSTVRIEIPEEQLLTPEELVKMMRIARGGGWL